MSRTTASKKPKRKPSAAAAVSPSTASPSMASSVTRSVKCLSDSDCVKVEKRSFRECAGEKPLYIRILLVLKIHGPSSILILFALGAVIEGGGKESEELCTWRFKDKIEAAEPEADPERDQRTVFAYRVDVLHFLLSSSMDYLGII
ncbi:hypothetical protein PTKIN_Ptkin17bG0059100 [Pterospermum kingtungense]